MTRTTATQPATETASRPFQIDIPESDLSELRRRINAARFPDKEVIKALTISALTKSPLKFSFVSQKS